jgi:hypothetical protein
MAINMAGKYKRFVENGHHARIPDDGSGIYVEIAFFPNQCNSTKYTLACVKKIYL